MNKFKGVMAGFTSYIGVNQAIKKYHQSQGLEPLGVYDEIFLREHEVNYSNIMGATIH